MGIKQQCRRTHRGKPFGAHPCIACSQSKTEFQHPTTQSEVLHSDTLLRLLSLLLLLPVLLVLLLRRLCFSETPGVFTMTSHTATLSLQSSW
jgi:hypothetical protein